MKRNQKGFAILEGLLILAIVAIIGGIGWYAVHTKHQTDKILSQADKISQSTPVTNPKNQTSTQLIDYTKNHTQDGIDITSAADVSKLTGAPSTFKAFVASEINKESSQTMAYCKESTAKVTVEMILGDSSAVGGVNSCTGHASLWANSSGKWSEIDGAQSTGFRCSILKQYKIPSVIAGNQCFDGTGAVSYSQD